MTELEQIEKSQAGDLNAFEKLILTYESRIYNFLYKMCRKPGSAEDMMQETFINAFRKINTFNGESKFSTWLFKIASNNCLMLKRKYGKQKVSSLDEPIDDGQLFIDIADWDSNPADLYEQSELKEKLDDALAELPEIYRAVFILKDIEGFKANEIADMLGVSLPNVKARILRARSKLQQIFKSKFS